MINKQGNIWLFLFIGLLMIGLITGGIIFKFWLAPKILLTQVQSANEIIDKTYDADNAIYNYEWFKSQHEKIIAIQNQIDNSVIQLDGYKEMFGDPKEWDWTTREEYNRLQSTLLGQRNQYENLVADYNARSKMANRNIFQNGLPFNIDKKIW